MRYAVSVILGLLGGVFIWLATPYNNFVIGNPLISDNYLPASAMVLLLSVVLILNPLLYRFAPRYTLSREQIAICFGIWLVACIPSSSGFLRIVPYGIVQSSAKSTMDKRLSEVYPADEVPEGLFPDQMGYGEPTPVARGFLVQASSDEQIPWGDWAEPAIRWSLFALFWWMMLMGLALVLFPQWRKNERLSFPLLTLMNSLIDLPEKGRCYAPLFRKRSFWIAAGGVFFIHLLAGINQYDPSLLPHVPLDWNIGDFFTQEPYRFLPEYIKVGHLYFVFVGVAFFMPNRISFSIWFFAIAYGVYTMIGMAYAPPFERQVITDQRTGAMLAFTLGVLWLGRGRWKEVLVSLTGRGKQADRAAFFLLLAGFLGLSIWLITAGVQMPLAIVYACIALVYAILITRIVAETGLILVGFEGDHFLDVIKFLPVGWVSAGSALIGGFVSAIVGFATRIMPSAVAMHTFGIREERPEGGRFSYAGLLLIVMVLGIFVSGAAHLTANYGHSSTIDGLEQPLNTTGLASFDPAWKLLQQKGDGAWDTPAYSQGLHIGFGAALAGGLQYLCLIMPRFPFHPVGLLFVYTWYMDQVWVSVFVGWLLKVLTVRYGGARLYEAAIPFFLGLILGEVFAAGFWVMVSVAMILLGRPYQVVEVLEKLNISLRLKADE